MEASDGKSVRFDVIVVGAGIMGSCAAYAAASRGARVLLLERFDLLHHRGSSHGESRTIRATYPQAHYPPMVRLARRLWDDAQRDAGYTVLTPTPHLDMGPRAEPALLAAVKNGGATEVVSGVCSLPWAEVFRVPDGWTAAASELGGVMKATKAVAMFQALAGKKGAAASLAHHLAHPLLAPPQPPHRSPTTPTQPPPPPLLLVRLRPRRISCLRRFSARLLPILLLALVAFLLYPSAPAACVADLRLGRFRVNPPPFPALNLHLALRFLLRTPGLLPIRYRAFSAAVSYRGHLLSCAAARPGSRTLLSPLFPIHDTPKSPPPPLFSPPLIHVIIRSAVTNG